MNSELESTRNRSSTKFLVKTPNSTTREANASTRKNNQQPPTCTHMDHPRTYHANTQKWTNIGGKELSPNHLSTNILQTRNPNTDGKNI